MNALSPALTRDPPEQRVGAFGKVPDMIRHMGGDPQRVLAEAGLDAASIDHPDKRIPFAALGTLLHAAARETQCPHFGLACGNVWGLDDLGLVGELARNAATVADAIRAIVMYQRLNSGGGMAFLVHHESTADFGYAIYHPLGEGSDQVHAAVLAGGHHCLREVCGDAWPVETVLLPFARPAQPDEYRRIFRCPVRFNADRAAMRFRGQWLAHPVAGADPEKYRVLETQALHMGPGEFMDRVVRSLRTLLVMGRHSGNDVADMLALHRRTLNRRLQADGTSFQEVLDAVRFEIARQLLSRGEIPMDEIAMSLGYSGLSAFQRTFRRWSGVTPGRWRRESRGDANTANEPALT